MRRWLAVLAVLAVACDGTSKSAAPLLNRCTQQLECTQSTCDSELGQCTLASASVPYEYRIRITPTALTDAGQLAGLITPAATLSREDELSTIVVPRSVSVRGSVRGAERALEAELVFTPREDNRLGASFSVFTRASAAGHAFSAALEPNRAYDVLVYPRGPDSTGADGYPPQRFELTTGSADLAQDFTYPALVTLRGQFRDEDDRPPALGLNMAAMHVRTRVRDGLLASSSVDALDKDGNFVLRLPQSVLDAPLEHELVLDLTGVIADNVLIAFDLSKRPLDDIWSMPRIPVPVQYVSHVAVAFEAASNAQLTFISDFALPTGGGDMRQTDWCQLKTPGAPRETFRCSANTSIGVRTDEDFAVWLLPGWYQVVATPAGGAPALQRLGTTLSKNPLIINSQVSGMQSGDSTVELSTASLFLSNVRSPGSRAMPSVAVSAIALHVLDDLPEVARYNRSDRQMTDYRGNATLAVDVGIYDLVASPPEATGFAWVLAYNRRIAGTSPNNLLPSFALSPEYPVMLRGHAISEVDAGVAEAEVDAYALVPDIEGGPDRAVRIAHTTTDREGNFALQMPPRIGIDDLNDGGVRDAGADAGAPDAQR